jgi:hypothetical protein
MLQYGMGTVENCAHFISGALTNTLAQKSTNGATQPKMAVEVKSYFKPHDHCYLNFLTNMIFDVHYEVIIDRFS